jgi:hypothetical protein
MDHGLWQIWFELRPLIERRWPNSPNQDLRAMETMIKELHETDPNAQRFRFPTASKDGSRHFPRDMSIDLENFCRSGRKVLRFLGGCLEGMSEAIDAQEPYEGDYE